MYHSQCLGYNPKLLDIREIAQRYSNSRENTINGDTSKDSDFSIT